MNEDGCILLAMCILSKKYLIPERVAAHYYSHTPLAGHHVPMQSWLDDELWSEMKEMSKILGSQKKAAELYGLHPAMFSRIIRGIDNYNNPLPYLKINQQKGENYETV